MVVSAVNESISFTSAQSDASWVHGMAQLAQLVDADPYIMWLCQAPTLSLTRKMKRLHSCFVLGAGLLNEQVFMLPSLGFSKKCVSKLQLIFQLHM